MSTKNPEIQKHQRMENVGPHTRIKVKEGSEIPVTTYQPGWLKVNSFDELMQHEKEILDRIAHTQNGANLFMAHPLMLLADIGVQLSEDAKKEIISREPHFASLSEVPYKALKASAEQPSIRFYLHGLFERRSS